MKSICFFVLTTTLVLISCQNTPGTKSRTPSSIQTQTPLSSQLNKASLLEKIKNKPVYNGPIKILLCYVYDGRFSVGLFSP